MVRLLCSNSLLQSTRRANRPSPPIDAFAHTHTHTTCRYVPKAVSDEEQERVHEMRALGHVDDGRAFVLCDASNSCREYWTLAKAWRKKREAGEASGRDEL